MSNGRNDKAGDALRGAIDAMLAEEIAAGTFPGAAYAVGSSREIVLAGAAGAMSLVPERADATSATIYDAASLTKPLVTTTLVLLALQQGRIALGDRVSTYIGELDQSTDKRSITIADLLAHRAGFQAWHPLYTEGTGRDAYLDAIVRRPLRYRPGSAAIYSDLGFILSGMLVERIFGDDLASLSKRLIFDPLGIDDAMFRPDASLMQRVAPTENGNVHERAMVDERGLAFGSFRTAMIRGEVNDGNAWHMGGAAGHAGLFATATAVARLAQAYMRPDLLLARETIARATRNHTLGFAENRGLGWQLQSARADHPSSPFSSRCFGHTGFTGTSVWIDPQRDLVVALMTNRIHPVVREVGIQAARRRFHEIVVRQS